MLVFASQQNSKHNLKTPKSLDFLVPASSVTWQLQGNPAGWAQWRPENSIYMFAWIQTIPFPIRPTSTCKRQTVQCAWTEAWRKPFPDVGADYHHHLLVTAPPGDTNEPRGPNGGNSRPEEGPSEVWRPVLPQEKHVLRSTSVCPQRSFKRAREGRQGFGHTPNLAPSLALFLMSSKYKYKELYVQKQPSPRPPDPRKVSVFVSHTFRWGSTETACGLRASRGSGPRGQRSQWLSASMASAATSCWPSAHRLKGWRYPAVRVPALRGSPGCRPTSIYRMYSNREETGFTWWVLRELWTGTDTCIRDGPS